MQALVVEQLPKDSLVGVVSEGGVFEAPPRWSRVKYFAD